MIRSWVTLVGALVALVVILATHFLGEAAGDFLAPLIFWLPVVALLLVIAAAVTSLAQDSSTDAGVGSPRPPEITSSAESSPPVTRVDRSGEGRWTELAEGCVEVIDELDQHIVGFDEPRQELAEHVMLRLEEVPLAYRREQNLPYYPVPREENRKRYNLYLSEAESLDQRVVFAGRLADYKYYNMDQAVARALGVFEKQVAGDMRL